MNQEVYDFVVIGAGIIGLATAFKLNLKFPDRKILVIEKEADLALHQTGHNSGVIHSGIYYRPKSLKAENCLDGYAQLIKFAKKFRIKFDVCGKIIVATSQEELPYLNELFERGQQNGLYGIRKLDGGEINEIEPYCRGLSAIHVPQTGIIDYKEVARKIFEILKETGKVNFSFNENVQDVIESNSIIQVISNIRSISCLNLISCAGLYSDRITRLTNTKNDLQIIPFRGDYYMLRPERQFLVNNLIYPVPNPNFPFLGVHFTRSIHGSVEAGPNAVFAFKREGYKFNDVSFKDLKDSLFWPGLWKVAAKYGKTGIGEMYRALSKDAFTKALQRLVPEIKKEDLVKGSSGVRAQACDRNGKLLDDFDIVHNGNVVHVRNAPSPAATSCLAIGETISNYFNN